MGELSVMGQRGDVRLSWDKSKPDEVEAAKKMFDDLKAKGCLAFKVVPWFGTRGQQIDAFDVNADRIILAPPMRGGAA